MPISELLIHAMIPLISPPIRCVLLLLLSASLVSACSNSSNPDTDDAQMLDGGNDIESPFIGTWIACRGDSTAESTRLTFVYDGATALFLEEPIFEVGCFNEPVNSTTKMGELVFENSIVDTALGFTAYPITFVDADADAEQANIRNLIYTDSSLLYFGITSSTNEPPTALETWVAYKYSGQPNFTF